MSGERTRFAPSPTGWLHLGHALAALAAHEAAADGQFHLRLEDLDRTRCRPAYTAGILEDLTWLGLDWTPPLVYQSERTQAYRDALAQLERLGLVYPCFCTRQSIAAEWTDAAGAPHSAPPVYPGTCRHRTDGAERIARGETHALRLDMQRALRHLRTPLTFHERGHGPAGQRGQIAADPAAFGDIVLARKELPAAYHLAVVVDDAFQGITLVTRGEDLFAATAVHRLLQALLGLPEPQYAHHRLVLGPDGRKFSKRDHAVTLRALRDAGEQAAQIQARLRPYWELADG